MSTKSDTKQALRQMRDDLTQLRDVVRVKLHLGRMDLKDRLEALEPQVRAFEQRAEEATEDVTDELREGYAHVKKALERLRDELEAGRRAER